MISLAEQNSWYPQLGDIIVVYPQHLEPHEPGYVGTIVSQRTHGGSEVVHVMWSDPCRKPPYYNEFLGYLVTNIHNLPHKFQLYRNGEKVRDVEPRWKK